MTQITFNVITTDEINNLLSGVFKKEYLNPAFALDDIDIKRAFSELLYYSTNTIYIKYNLDGVLSTSDIKDIEIFRTSWLVDYALPLLNYLCSLGKIQPGEYLIELEPKNV